MLPHFDFPARYARESEVRPPSAHMIDLGSSTSCPFNRCRASSHCRRAALAMDPQLGPSHSRELFLGDIGRSARRERA